jgi:hypothetical protein
MKERNRFERLREERNKREGRAYDMVEKLLPHQPHSYVTHYTKSATKTNTDMS